MKKVVLISVLFIAILSLNAQIAGRITDSKNNEALTGANVVIYEMNSPSIVAQTVSDKRGRFSASVKPEAGMRLVVSYIGYDLYEIILKADDNLTNLDLSLNQAIVPVGEVMITAIRHNKHLKNISLPMSVLDRNEINKSSGLTPSELLRNEPGLYLSRDGIWATSLNIRGLSEQRIVTLVDGNRVETATDIAAGMSMIDPNEIERIEVIKGAASSLYGTGALGGVVNIITKDGYFSDDLYAGGSAALGYQTVNSMPSAHAAVNVGDKRWYIRLSGSMRDAANTMTPEGELENSQFSDNNLSLKAGVKTFKNHSLKLNLQRYEAKDVGIPGGKSFPGPATATYPQEKRDLISAEYVINTNRDFLKDLSFRYFRQYILRDVELIPNPNATITPSGYHTTNGFTSQANMVPFEGHSLIAGIDVWRRNLRTERYKDIYQPVKDEEGNVIGTNHIFRAEIPIPETDFTSGGLFLNDEFYALNDRLKIDIGGRFDFINVKNEEAVDPLYLVINEVRNDNPPNQRVTFEANNVNNHSWSANLGLLYSLSGNTDLTASLSRAFRSPSIEERFKYIDLGSTVSVGDPELEPENGYFADLGLKIWKEKFHLSVNGFVNSMSNLIVEMPGEIEYSYIDQPDRIDTIPALINSNVDEALLYGYDFSFSYNFIDRFLLFGSSSYVRGMDTKNNSDLPLIPPLNGRLGLKYSTSGGYGIEAVCNLVADQEKVAEGETPTFGYASYDLRFYTKTFRLNFAHLSLFGGIENITDRAFVNHLSTNRGLIKFEPGRNFYIRMRMEF